MKTETCRRLLAVKLRKWENNVFFFYIRQSRSDTKNDVGFFYVSRDCDSVSFRTQSFVIANLKYLHMLLTVLSRSLFVPF